MKRLRPKSIVFLFAALLGACAQWPTGPLLPDESPPRAEPPPTAAHPPAPPSASPAVQPPITQPAGVSRVTPAFPTVTPGPVTPATPPRSSVAQIALLLPLSGSFAASAQAVRDGFVSAAFDDPAHPRVRVYDIGRTPEGLRTAYQRALSEGAGMIAGPLTKEDVAALAGFVPPVPVLALNYVDAGTTLPYNFFQYGLAPEDEARAAAAHAASRGLRRAVALVPNTEWGQRTLAAFDAALRASGGAVVRAERYGSNVNDQSRLIANLMGVAASEERHAALTSVLGAKSEFESRRRGDVDLIFVGARAQDARLLVPQIRFNRGGDLPVYATSLLYDGKPSADLSGVRFCDAPWMIGNDAALQAQRSSYAGLPGIDAAPRLFAMGRDAYALASGLLSGRVRVGDPLAGVTGRLDWGGSRLITRTLDCVQMAGDSLRAVAP